MIVMQLGNIKKSYATDLIFDQVNLEIKSGETTGIVGKNGAGKTTLMKIMAGELSYDEGTVSVPKGTSIGYLTQQMTLESSQTVREEMMRPFSALLKLKSDIESITHWLSEHDYSHEQYDDQLKKFEQLQNRFENADGYNIDMKIKTVITGLNFDAADLDRNVDEFSGGQKTRLALGQMLLTNPDLLLLDEPTNHLDMTTVGWLEQYLNSFPGAVVIISHDRYFLDRTVDRIFEVEMFRGTLYHTNYTKYVTEKEKRFSLQMKAYEQQQKEIKKLETFVEKNIARASTSGMAKSRRKQLEHIDRLQTPMQDRRNANFSFDIRRESGNDVLKIKNIGIGYEDTLNDGINFNVDKGDRIAIIGPNGIGKSTLVKTIARLLPKHGGEIIYGTNVSIGYYDQKQAEFTSSRTILEELWHEYPGMNESDVRTVLGRFLFTQDEVLKLINDLSGGEKARIQLAKMMLEKNNLLILDEPTNHLDIDSKEVLENALQNYPGTIIFVSHDRYFIDRIATKVIEMDHRKIDLYHGDYSYYTHKKEERESLEIKIEASGKKEDSDTDYQAQKQQRNEMQRLKRSISKIEDEITKVEKEIGEIEETLLNPDVYGDYEKADEYNKQLEQKNSELEELMIKWEEVEDMIDDE
ncbi:ATP-binding cassette domain-containing protein [Salinicoccus halodurans]|uniref:ABC transporter ATP-binding protein n=1 Tax=Salinicoccus halodurans TaxID=407035 RepID=A0A0F7HNK2_9STAP|nr:ATP-binding cassette domain-containing protein [Salinicoccus halodurans]AKG74754.1 ABC transporter ATP-binding protein [Salinicoccus halodurans]SFK87606.1 ATP-binding cassette, subfamily F, member 3 [Salinicoccus halodurans]